jgi:selenide,water dikinase
MASGSGVTMVLESKKLPLLPGARRLAQQGCLTGGCRRNRDYLRNKITVDPSVRDDLFEVALDPQTSGGLLIALPSEHADGLVEKLRSIRVDGAVRIGYATVLQDVSVRLI